jgi:thiamine-phosphate pyrophosphorylase
MVVPPLVLLVTDPAYAESHVEGVVRQVGAVLEARFGVILRDKLRPRAEVAAFAARLRAATRTSGSPFFVHSDPSLALEVEADGAHLGSRIAGPGGVRDARRALPGAWISVAAHTDADVHLAIEQGADAALVSPIYDTPGKGPARGASAIASARALAPALAVYALGGVDPSRARACMEAGANGVAVIRALLSANDPVSVARAFAAGWA